MTYRFAHAAAREAAAIVGRLIEGLGPAPFPRGPGFLYFTDRIAHAVPTMLASLREATGVEHWIGSTGVGVLASGVEYVDEPAATALVCDWPSDEYSVFSGKRRPPGAGALTPSGARAAQFAIVHADPETPDIADLVGDMSSKVASGFLVGGLASAHGKASQLADELLTGGVSGVVVSSAIEVTTRLTQGCSALPGRYTVTSGEGNVIATIDHRPALDVYREAADDLGRDLERAVRTVLVGLPVEGSDRGDYLVRNVIGVDPRAKLVAIGAAVEPGMPLIFCRRDAVSARRDLVRMLNEIKRDLRGPPRGGLYFSCLARGEHMFGARSAEAALVREHLGDVPLAGFFAAGEISHDRLYGYTGVLTLFM